MSAQLHLLAAAYEMALADCIMWAISSDARRARFMRGSAIRDVTSTTRALIDSYLQSKQAKAHAEPARAHAIAIEVRERVRFHAGPPRHVTREPAGASDPSAMAPGAWIELGDAPHQRNRPPPDGRILSGRRTWGIERLGELPEHTVICYERAASRVQDWRTDNGMSQSAQPPLTLLNAIVHCTMVPTALASPADHFYLPVLHRWATPSEVLNMFGVASDHPMRAVLCCPPVSPLSAVSMLGRSVHAGAAARAIQAALTTLPFTPSPDHPIRYASACSGIDVPGTVMDSLAPGAWTYAFASECDPAVADALTRSHAHRGLLRGNVFPDATAPAATRDAPPCDVWVVTPPMHFIFTPKSLALRCCRLGRRDGFRRHAGLRAHAPSRGRCH